MKQSQLFTKTQKTPPAGEESRNARLLEQGGFVYKNSAGIYTQLPLGWRVIQKIQNIIREEMNAIEGQEMYMPALHDKHYLEATGRWDVDVVFKIWDKGKAPQFNISWTHEEIMSEIASKYVSSYKDLPFSTYQIQTKFRNEPRAKSGLLRGREFMMKDLYSFHTDEDDLNRYYDIVKGAYFKIFSRCGLKSYYTLAAGGDFTANFTHEFQVTAPVGEDTIFLCSKCGYAENKEISKLKDGDECPKCGSKIKQEKSIEVGNIFRYGTKYSEPFGLQYTNEKGESKYVYTGAYGIGLGRLMATIVEIYNDEKGIIWPDSVAPFQVHLLALKGGGKQAEKIYKSLLDSEIEVLFDDRELQAGEKFADADLIGIPHRAVISEKTKGKIELKKRNENKADLIDLSAVIAKIKK